MIDRRKFNFNLLLVGMLIIIFMMQLYNQKMLIHNSDRLLEIHTQLTEYFSVNCEPPLPIWENPSVEQPVKPKYRFE